MLPDHRTSAKLGALRAPLIDALLAVAIVLGPLLTAPSMVWADTLTVTSTADDGSVGTLRQALAAASDFDTIDATGVSGTILLSGGPLVVIRNVTILGPGPANLAIDGNATYRVFEVHGSPFRNGDVVLSGLTITNGVGNYLNYTDGGGGIYNDDMVGTLRLENCIVINNAAGCCSGGGITNTQYLSINNSTVTGNSTPTYHGGGINNRGSLSISNSTISENTTGGSGAGIYNTHYLTVDNSIISGNSAGFGGGGVTNEYNSYATAVVNNSTISGNSAFFAGGINNSNSTHLTVMNSTISANSFTDHGGGIDNGGVAIVINSTISGNYGPAGSGFGGGITNGTASLTVKDSTFSGNSSRSGGAIFNWLGGTTRIGDTVLDVGATGGTLFNNNGAIISLGYNLSSDAAGGFLTATGDQINTDPMLGPLQDNGGPTFTHALLTGSPAIDVGDPAFDPNSFNPPMLNDQRGPGFPRVVNGRIDIGAFEAQGAATTTTVPTTTRLTTATTGAPMTSRSSTTTRQ